MTPSVRRPLGAFRLRLAYLLHLAYPRGFCHACQRVTEWDDRGDRYRCRHCGADPVEAAEPGG